MTKAITTLNETTTPETLIELAIKQNVPVESLERLMALRREWRAEIAKSAFDEALSNFQAECPTIEKRKPGGETKGGKVAYMYAPIESIVEQVKDLLTKNGLSYTFDTEMMDTDEVKVICYTKHVDGHSEQTSVLLPLSTRTGVMSAPQQVAATITYAKRYSFCNAFGIMTGDEDTDAKVTPEQNLDEYKAKIKDASNLDELKGIWSALPAEAKAQLDEEKNIAKERLSIEEPTKEVVAELVGVSEQKPYEQENDEEAIDAAVAGLAKTPRELMEEGFVKGKKS